MAYEVEVTGEFRGWYEDNLDANEQKSVARVVEMLVEAGPALSHPYSSSITTSKHAVMRELRIQHAGRPYRVLYAFDPRRTALLLLGGDKSGEDRWYDRTVPLADRLYAAHLRTIKSKK